MKIPEVRTVLLQIADEIEDGYSCSVAERIRELVKELHRRPYVRKVGPRRQRPNTGAVKAYARAHPDDDYMDIATHFDANPGRISEALAGFRK